MERGGPSGPLTGPVPEPGDEGPRFPGPPRSIYIGPWRIDLSIRPGSARLPSTRASLARAVARAVEAAGAPSPASIGLVLSDDRELADLNQRHLNAEGSTDVLSFPLLAPEAYPPHPGKAGGSATASEPAASLGGTPAMEGEGPGRPRPTFALPAGVRTHLGDLIVSVERAIAQASEGRGGQTGDVRWDPADELRLLVIHGALHLCGWDHEDPVERDAMRALERELLAHG
jgi:probable rRNA maturation factor